MSDLVPIVVGGALALAGGAGTEWLRDTRLNAREEHARRAMRQERREDLQRQTLIELQDALQTYVRSVGAIRHFDWKTEKEHGRQALLPAELDQQAHDSQILTQKLNSRVQDEETRKLVGVVIEKGISATMPNRSTPRPLPRKWDLPPRQR